MNDTPVDSGTVNDGLNSAQRRVVEGLMAWGQPRPSFDSDLSERLHGWLQDALGPVLDQLPSSSSRSGERLGARPIRVTKRMLAQVHACEAHFVAERAERATAVAWSPRMARGLVAHKAVELAVSCRDEPTPLELVDHAVDSLAADDRPSALGKYLAATSPLELAELRADANDVVVKFLESWPRLRPAWSPRTETTIGADVCDGRVQLRGKVDLALGRAKGLEARVLIVDLKTGASYATHLDDLRFYALVQVLRVGVPPFRVASYYLDTATFHSEDVTVDSLELAVSRVAHGVRRLVELESGGREAEITPGPTCRYCRLRHDCDGPRLLRQESEEL